MSKIAFWCNKSTRPPFLPHLVGTAVPVVLDGNTIGSITVADVMG